MKTARYRAAYHEARCPECRVTWRSWVLRLFNVKAGFAPHVRIARNDGSDER